MTRFSTFSDIEKKVGQRMNITTHRIKQYNSTYKTVVCVDGKPICIVAGVGKTLSNVIGYLNGYDVPIADAKVKKALDRCRAESEDKNEIHRPYQKYVR